MTLRTITAGLISAATLSACISAHIPGFSVPSEEQIASLDCEQLKANRNTLTKSLSITYTAGSVVGQSLPLPLLQSTNQAISMIDGMMTLKQCDTVTTVQLAE